MILRSQRRLQQRHHLDGYALPIAMALALITMTLMSVSLMEAQSNRDSSQFRQASGGSTIVSDSAIARVLVELAKPDNGVLLARNYDPKNPTTGKNYLGPDGIVNSGDETTVAVDEWTGYTPSTFPCYQALGYSNPNLAFLSGEIGERGSYKILAYRYDAASQIGTILIEGVFQQSRSQVLLSLSINPMLDSFPGIGLIKPYADDYHTGMLALRNREILGGKGNVYFVSSSSNDPTLAGESLRGDSVRASYLDAIWSSASDGASTDAVSGSIVACNLNINIPKTEKGENLGIISTSTTLSGVGSPDPTRFQVEKVDLAGTDTLTVDTTGGPVVIDMIEGLWDTPVIQLRDKAKIVNVRTDGQPPRVGDVRIMIRSNNKVFLYDQSCMQQVFLYSWTDELQLLTSGPGCPSGQNTNFEGVAWVEAILSSKNAQSNRNVQYLGALNQSYDTIVTPGATSGIAVPEDVSSLVDLLKYTNWPLTYRYGAIKNWQQVRL